MAIVVEAHLRCDLCDEPFGVDSHRARDSKDASVSRELRIRAKEIDGWIRFRRDGKLVDCCYGCRIQLFGENKDG